MTRILNREVGATGYGLMGFTWRPDPAPLDQALDALKAAVESGCTLWSGAEFYGTPEYNSLTLLNHYFTKYPEDASKVTIVIKGASNLETLAPDASPEGVRKSIDNILRQLDGKKHLDIFSCARRDGTVPLKETMAAIQEYIDSGKISGVGLSESSAETIHEASKLINVAVAELELSLFTPDILHNGIAAACGEHNIPIIAYSPMGRGMLTGRFKGVADVQHWGYIASFPRFQEENFKKNLKLVEQVETLAKQKGCSAAQLALAWDRHMGNRDGRPAIVPIPGATTAARVKENASAVELDGGEIAAIQKIIDGFETAGDRYPDYVRINT